MPGPNGPCSSAAAGAGVELIRQTERDDALTDRDRDVLFVVEYVSHWRRFPEMIRRESQRTLPFVASAAMKDPLFSPKNTNPDAVESTPAEDVAGPLT